MSQVLNIAFLPAFLRLPLIEHWSRVEKDVDYQQFWIFLFELLLSQSSQLSGKAWTNRARLALHNSYSKHTNQMEGILAERNLLHQLQRELASALPRATTVDVNDITKQGNGGDLMCLVTAPGKKLSRISIELKRYTSTLGNPAIRAWQTKVTQWAETYGKIDVAIICTLGPIADKPNPITYEEGKQTYLYISSVPETMRLSILSLFCAVYYRRVYPSKLVTPSSLHTPIVQMNQHITSIRRVVEIKRKLEEQLHLLDRETKRMVVDSEEIISKLKQAQSFSSTYPSAEKLSHAFQSYLNSDMGQQRKVK